MRYALNADFMDEMGKHEFFAFRKRGVEPSQIPVAVTDDLVAWIAGLPDETVFKVEDMPGYVYAPVKGSFNKTKCSSCGEYVFDRYVRTKDGAAGLHPLLGLRTRAAASRRSPWTRMQRLHISAGLLQELADIGRSAPTCGLPARRRPRHGAVRRLETACGATATARR